MATRATASADWAPEGAATRSLRADRLPLRVPGPTIAPTRAVRPAEVALLSQFRASPVTVSDPWTGPAGSGPAGTVLAETRPPGARLMRAPRAAPPAPRRARGATGAPSTRRSAAFRRALR